MHSQTRIVVLLGTLTLSAMLAAAVSQVSPEPSPDLAATSVSPPEPPRLSPAGTATKPALASEADAMQAVATLQRTAVKTVPVQSPAQATKQDRVRLRAATLATELALSTEGEEALLVVLLQEQERREVALAELRREPNNEATKTRIRREFTAIREWKTRELRAQFEAEQVSRLMRRR